jgi:uncharacterized protein (DUF2147 family)
MSKAIAWLFAAVLSGSAHALATPEGLWETREEAGGERRSLVRIAIRDGRLAGVVVRVFPRPGEGTDPVCTRCRGSRQGQKVVGMEILWGHTKDGERWDGGTVLDPENGKEYPSTVWLEKPDELRMRGHWGPFHRTDTWRRVPVQDGSR